MTRLVLHTGAEFADAGAVQRDLVGWREPLRDHGVLLPGGATATEWRETAQGLLRRKQSSAATELLAGARETNADVILVSADTLTDTLTSPDEVAALVAMARDVGVELRVVVVVREQIGYVNALYCRRVLALETARSFAEFATTSVPAHRFDYVASFGAIADADGVELVAVGYPDLVVKGAGNAVLEAAGAGDDVIEALPAADAVPESLPGPVVVGAARLLHKRMRRLGLFNEYGKPRLRLALDGLVSHAIEAGWDTTQFWGWDLSLRRQAEEEHGPTNTMFAEFVWDRPWPEPWSTGKPNRVDLADLRPPLLADVFSTVDDVLKRLSRPPSMEDPAYAAVEAVLPTDADFSDEPSSDAEES